MAVGGGAPLGTLPLATLPPTNYTLVLDAGGFLLTGVNAGLTYVAGTGGTPYILTADPASFNVGGVNAGLTYVLNARLVADPGGFRLSGLAATLQGPDEARSKGGWDPYTYKRRNKRRDKIDDVRQFMADILGRDLEDAPPEIIEQAAEAKSAAREVLALAPTGLDTDARNALTAALDEINEFYRLVRERVRLARKADEDEDDFLLLAA